MSLFLTMDTACMAELSPTELATLHPVVYAHLLEICSRVAEEGPPHVELDNPLPRPPATQYIRADLIIPDDFVWRTDLSFDQVDATTDEAGEVVIVYRGGRTTIHEPTDHVRVAVSPIKAQRWNEERVFMGEETLRSVAEAYGVF